MSEVQELTLEQWEQIKPKVIISSYGASATFFDNLEDMRNAKKIVTLNGSPIKATSKRGSSIYERAVKMAVKLPNGQFAVLSDTLRKDTIGLIGRGKIQKLPDGL